MANELTYQSEFTGQQMDARFTAVPELQQAVSALVASLANYYTKAQVDAITASIAAAVNATKGVTVEELPSASADTLGAVYYVGPDAGDEYDRYITGYDGATYSWLPLGSTAIDLSDYVTQDELDAVDAKVGESEIIHGEESIDIGTLVDGSIRHATGAGASSTTNKRSDFINIESLAGKTLIYSRQKTTAASPAQGLAFYTSNDASTYISGEAWVGSAAQDELERREITVPATAKYVRFCVIGTFADSAYMKKPTETVVYTSGLGKDVQELKEEVAAIEADIDESLPVVVMTDNLLDPAAVTDGYILDDDTSGGIHASASYFTSDYIPVSSEVTYRSNRAIRRLVLYSASKQYLSLSDNVAGETDISPAQNGFIRISCANSTAIADSYFGDKTKQWEVPYGPKSIKIAGAEIAKKSEIPANPFAGKNLAIIGDSSADSPTHWPSRLGTALGVGSCDLYAAGGYTWRNKFSSGSLTSCIGVLINSLIASDKDYDIILIQLGGNDLGGTSTQMGDVDTAFDSYNYLTLEDAEDSASCVRYYLELLKRTFPNALLIVDTVFQRLGSKTGESAKAINDILRASCQRLGIVCLDGEGEVGFSGFLEPSPPYYNDGTPGVANDRTNLSRSNPTYNYIEDASGDIVDYATATEDGDLKTGYSKRYGLYTYDGKHQNLRGENKVLDFMVASLRSLYQSDFMQTGEYD